MERRTLSTLTSVACCMKICRATARRSAVANANLGTGLVDGIYASGQARRSELEDAIVLEAAAQ